MIDDKLSFKFDLDHHLNEINLIDDLLELTLLLTFFIFTFSDYFRFF